MNQELLSKLNRKEIKKFQELVTQIPTLNQFKTMETENKAKLEKFQKSIEKQKLKVME